MSTVYQPSATWFESYVSEMPPVGLSDIATHETTGRSAIIRDLDDADVTFKVKILGFCTSGQPNRILYFILEDGGYGEIDVVMDSGLITLLDE